MNTLMYMLRTLEGAFGYFLPFLLLGLFFRPRQCWKNTRVALIFGIGSCGLLALYLLLGRDNPVSRYLFIPVLLCCFFCGGGLAGILSKLRPSRRATVLWCVCILICVSSAFQIAFRGRKHYVSRFAQKILDCRTSGKPIVLYSDQSDANKIAAILKRQQIPCELVLVTAFERKSFMVDLPFLDPNEKELYLLTGIPKQQSAGDWRQELQSCCYLTPFDLVAESVYRRRRYLLWRFNGKVGSDLSTPIASLPETFPAEIHFSGNQKLNYIRVCDAGMLKAGKSYLFSYSDWYHNTEDNFLQHYFQGDIGDRITFSCGNEYYWPQAIVLYQKTRFDTLKKVQTSVFSKNVFPAEDPMLRYPVGKVIYPENFSLDWSAFAVNQYTGKEYTVTGTENRGHFTGRMIHNQSRQSVSFEIPVIRQNLNLLKKKHFDILWLANHSSNPIDISAQVAELSGTITIKHCPAELFLTSYNDPAKDIAKINFPQFQPDILMLDIFAHSLSDKSFFEFDREDFFDKLDQTLTLLRKKYPDTQIMLLLPPVPAKRESQLPRYRLSFLMQEFTRLRPTSDLWIIDPVGAIQPNHDFLKTTDQEHYHAPVVLTKEGKEKTAQVVLAHLAHFLAEKNIADKRGKYENSGH